MRKILHIDCDCFFAAVEMRENPQLCHVPIAIGGHSDRRGVISTCNYPARKFGIHSAMATAQALKKCPDLILLPSNMALYREVSQQVMAIIQRYGIAYEQVSVDEAYLELDPDDSAIEVGEKIRAEVEAKVGITVSVGAAPNKFLAKIASDWNKPNGLFAVKPHKVDAFVQQLEVRKIPGIGPKTAARLAAKGIVLCSDAQQYSLLELVNLLGGTGVSLFKRCRGQDDRALSLDRMRKSISIEHTFANDLYLAKELDDEVAVLWDRFLLRTEKANIDSRQLSPFVKVKFNDFTQTTLADQLLEPSLDSFRQLLQQARLRNDKNEIQGVRLIGIGGRCPDINEQQLTLF
ncbi:MAG: DNA polymerase-4 [Oleispira sp.]|jgi:DNA polymerase-4